MYTKDGSKEFCKAYGVQAILSDSIGREALPSGLYLLPHVTNPKEVFAKMPEKQLDLLIGYSDLRLQPKCPKLLQGRSMLCSILCYVKFPQL